MLYTLPCQRAGFEQMVAETNRSEMGRRNGGAVVSAQPSERMLLLNLLARLHELDADVYVGHNVSAFDLDVLLHRLQFHKVPTSGTHSASQSMPKCREDPATIYVLPS